MSTEAAEDDKVRAKLEDLRKEKEFYEKEEEAHKLLIKQTDDEIKVPDRKIGRLYSERGEMIQKSKGKPPEFVQLENLSNSLHQKKKALSTVLKENKDIVENIMRLEISKKNFQTIENDLRRKIEKLKLKSEELLEKSLAAFEEKDAIQQEEKTFQERSTQEMQKEKVKENQLKWCLRKAEKNEHFAKLQGVKRTDARITGTADMKSKYIADLKPHRKAIEDLQSAISGASGEKTRHKMEENFKLDNDQMYSMFSYLDTLLKYIYHLEKEITRERKENYDLVKGLSTNDRSMLNENKKNQDRAQEMEKEAENSAKLTEEARSDMESVLETVRHLYSIFCPEDASAIKDQPLDELNVIDFLQNIEKEIHNLLAFLTNLYMQEETNEEKP